MKLGMVGLPNVGKSTLFNALTNSDGRSGAAAANYPFCTIEQNVGIVSVPDTRLDWLADFYKPAKFTPAALEFADIAGLVRGASKGEGLGNKFLADIREADALVHVVRCFDDDNIIHVDGSVNAARDIETINLELVFSDLEMLARRTDKARKTSKANRDAAALKELDFLERLTAHLESGQVARAFDFTEDELELLKQTPLLSQKPVIYAANLSEKDFAAGYENNQNYKQVSDIAKAQNAEVLPICAALEAELGTLADAEERALFLADIGLAESGLTRIIRQGYQLLGLISFLTAGSDEVRAWTIKRGTKAPQAAGKIHTDFERGFIRAEIVGFTDLKTCGNMHAAKEKGLVRLEGKDYVMKDGDVTLFRFNV